MHILWFTLDGDPGVLGVARYPLFLFGSVKFIIIDNIDY